MNEMTRRLAERQRQINKMKKTGSLPEAHLSASVVNQVYKSWADLFKNHTDLVSNDFQSLYPKGINVVIDDELEDIG